MKKKASVTAWRGAGSDALAINIAERRQANGIGGGQQADARQRG
jgi:hypothetical protein